MVTCRRFFIIDQCAMNRPCVSRLFTCKAKKERSERYIQQTEEPRKNTAGKQRMRPDIDHAWYRMLNGICFVFSGIAINESNNTASLTSRVSEMYACIDGKTDCLICFQHSCILLSAPDLRRATWTRSLQEVDYNPDIPSCVTPSTHARNSVPPS